MTHLAARSTAAPSLSRSAPLPIVHRGLLLLAASTFVALCAHVSVPVPFTPVPVVLSDFAVLLVGLVLGPAMGFGALVCYLAEGAAGLPVFSPLGPGGMAQMLGPTGGYLLAYPFAAALVGSFRTSSFGAMARMAGSALGAVAGTLVILTLGTIWLAHWGHLNVSAAVALAMTPFAAGAVAKAMTAVAVATAGERLISGRSKRSERLVPRSN